MKSSFLSLALLLLICFVSFTQSRDYTLAVDKETNTNTIFVAKNSATSSYTGKVLYSGEGTDPCAWVFCITRSFRGIITEHNEQRILTDTEGCLLVSQENITTDEESYEGALLTPSFAWNAQGEFYMNGQLLQGDCSASLTVTGSECENMGEFGLECEEATYANFPLPHAHDPVLLTPTELPSLVFPAVPTSPRPGVLNLLMDVDDDSSGLDPPPSEDLGYVRLLLNGIPTENDYDFEVPLTAPQTTLRLSATRRDSTYFYSVQATTNVSVYVGSLSLINCVSPTYGPNCSITAKQFTSDDAGQTMTFDPTVDTFCYNNDTCYFTLVQKSIEITVMPQTHKEDDDALAILYKTNNFPTATDYDVAMPGDTSFIPTFLETSTTATFAVFSPNGASFTILLGKAPPPPPPPPPSDDELPWVWIGVTIALGGIALGLIIGFAIFLCKPARTYTNVE